MKAMPWEQEESVQLLLEHGADAGFQNADGWTASKIATEKGNNDNLRILQSAGADH